MGYQAQFPYRLEYDFPSVRQLGLVQITARWESFSNLTRLYLRGGRHTLDITFRELRNIILRSPGLEYLSLTATVPVICDLPEHTIHLPHLQCLSLETNSDLISHLLQAIESVPPSAHVRIWEPAGLGESMACLPRGISHLSPLQITPTTVLRFVSGEGLTLLSAGAKRWSDDIGKVRFRIYSMATQRADGFFNRWLYTIPTHFDVSLLTTLELQIDPKVNPTILTNFLFSMPLLHTLRVDGPYWASAITALSTIRADLMLSSPCPLLTRIEVGVGNLLWDYLAPSQYGPTIQPIAEGLRERFVSLGYPLQTLVLSGSFSKSVTKHFKPYVVEIITAVDGDMVGQRYRMDNMTDVSVSD